MSLVLDASMTLAWVFERIEPAESLRARSVLQRLRTESATAPMLWRLEVTNGLLTGLRRNVTSEAKVVAFQALIETVSIQVEDSLTVTQIAAIFALARQHGLSAYDAAYLDLALRRGLPLATFDRRLAAACEAAGVPLA